ncbi:transposon, En/Spm-like, Transposase-associated domain protein [Artemisia annua]|uniref:Transposon, En/Spm-like, Transposase-associated domain protein n=1 Tax=Artemisia annua TaxID=35608 RepID=A0A2U1PKT2_ARTAN|nr:transposon, En/Spm-like, Transposase-associated domain protein [Artemisia annua]
MFLFLKYGSSMRPYIHANIKLEQAENGFEKQVMNLVHFGGKRGAPTIFPSLISTSRSTRPFVVPQRTVKNVKTLNTTQFLQLQSLKVVHLNTFYPKTFVMLASAGSNAHLKCLAQFPSTNVFYCKGYLINGYKFHTQTAYDGRVTQNSGVCVKGAFSYQDESDYYGLLDEIIEVEYDSDLGRCLVVVFNCTWGDVEEVPCNLDDDTNDGDVEEDEFEDIISDENDDYLISAISRRDLGSQSLGKYRFQISVIIMSSGRRHSGPKPSHGDVSGSGSGNGGVRQMLLDNHHIDDDNDEGVEVTEPSVEASNAKRGFDDQKSVGHSITSILQFRFSEPWATWSCVQREKKDQIWLRFKWDPRIDEAIRKRFVKHATSRWNCMLNAARTRAIRLYEKNSMESKHGRPVRSTEFFTYTNAMKGSRPLDQPPIVSGSNRSAGANGSTGTNGSTGANVSAGANGPARANGSVGANGSAMANGLAGANGSVGESSGGQAVEPRWVNDKSCHHMEKYQEGMIKSHGENVDTHPHDEELWNKVTPPNRGNTFWAYNASDHIFLLTGTPSTQNASTSHPPMRFEKHFEV